MADEASDIDVAALRRGEASFRAAMPAAWDGAVFGALAGGGRRVLVASDPCSSASLGQTLRSISDFFDAWQPGDVALTNDVQCGSTHPSEFTAVAPLFSGAGEPAGWTLLRADCPDIGGWALGSVSPRALDIWSEGARIVPARLVAAGRVRREVTDMLSLNSRTPKLIGAWTMALVTGVQALADALPKALAVSAAVAADARNRTANALARISGEHHGIGAVPIPGGGTLALQVQVRRHGERLQVSFPDSPQSSVQPLNASRAIVADCVARAVAAALTLDVRAAVALPEFIELAIAEGSLLAASWRLPAGWARAVTGRAVYLAVCNALDTDASRGWLERDPYLDAATGGLDRKRSAHIASLEMRS